VAISSFTLPEDFRPKQQTVCTIISQKDIEEEIYEQGLCFVNQNGNIYIQHSMANNWSHSEHQNAKIL
jgi:hypothetical protein